MKAFQKIFVLYMCVYLYMCVLNNSILKINLGKNKQTKKAPRDVLFFIDPVPLQNEAQI